MGNVISILLGIFGIVLLFAIIFRVVQQIVVGTDDNLFSLQYTYDR